MTNPVPKLIEFAPGMDKFRPGLSVCYIRNPQQQRVRSQQDISADLEFVCTQISRYGWSTLYENEHYLPGSIRALAWYDRVDALIAILRRMEHYCMKCKVICNYKKHICTTCLLCTFPGLSSAKCNCFDKCEFSVRPVESQVTAHATGKLFQQS